MERTYCLTESDKKDLDVCIGFQKSAWEIFKDIVYPKKFFDFLDKLLKDVSMTKKRRKELEIIAKHAKDVDYEKTDDFDRELITVLKWAATKLFGVVTSTWNIQSRLNQMRKNQYVERSSVFPLAVALGFSAEETRKLLFHGVKIKEQDDFNPRRLDEMIYLMVLEKKLHYGKDLEEDGRPSLQKLMKYAQVEYMKNLFGEDHAVSYEKFVDFLDFYKFNKLWASKTESVNILNPEEIHDTIVAYALYCCTCTEIPCFDQEIRTMARKEGLTEKKAITNYLECYKKQIHAEYANGLRFYQKIFSPSRKGRKPETIYNLIECYYEYTTGGRSGSELYEKLKAPEGHKKLLCALDAFRTMAEEKRMRVKTKEKVEAYQQLEDMVGQLKQEAETMNIPFDLYVLEAALIRVQKGNPKEIRKILSGKAVWSVQEKSAFGWEILDLAEFLRIFCFHMLSHIEWMQKQQWNSEQKQGEMIRMHRSYDDLYAHAYFSEDSALYSAEAKNANNCKDIKKDRSKVKVRGKNINVQKLYDCYGTVTVALLADAICELDGDAFDFVDHLLADPHIYELGRDEVISGRYRFESLKSYAEKYASKDEEDVPGFYDAGYLKKQLDRYEKNENVPITRKDVIKLYFFVFCSRKNYTVEQIEGHMMYNDFIRKFDSFAVRTMCSEYSAQNPLDRFLGLCLKHSEPLDFMKAALEYRKELADLF